MALNHEADGISEPVTVWHFLTDTVDCVCSAVCHTAVYHTAVYDGAVTTAERAAEVRIQRHGVAEMQGFLFPSGHLLPVTPAVGMDFVARGDWSAYETPTGARDGGAAVYCFAEVIRPPRLSGGSMTEWVQFTANAVV